MMHSVDQQYEAGSGDRLYAHSVQDQPVENWQKLGDHLRAVAVRAADWAGAFQSTDWGWNAGWLHDIGKAADEFQAYLMRENGLDDSHYDASGRVNHSSAGAALAEEKFNHPGVPAGRPLAYVTAGHHAGLPDWSEADSGNAALRIRLVEGLHNLERIRPAAERFAENLREVKAPPAFVTPQNFHLWVRMLYSCLVDADFLDTEAFLQQDKAAERQGFATLADLKARFDHHMASLAAGCPRTPVNAIRQDILAACRAAAVQPPGVFSLTVPTGGGKTLSGMAFAMDHAAIHGKRRIIYVIPYTSIIEQTANTLADIFGRENVVEHHSNLDLEESTQRAMLAAENWDASVVVTTSVQFFESLFAARSSRCRKLHNVVNSVVILDEAQLLPPELLTPCQDALNQLVRHYGVTVVLATATQPFLQRLEKPVEIVANPGELYRQLTRTQTVWPSSLHEPTSWEALAERLVAHEQVLCVVNARRDCYDLFKAMPAGTIHLSALMCGEHRSKIIQQIKGRLREGLPTRVISTQLVEAGVDIDFPVVYRALSGIDSIAQAAGRCNREGRLNAAGLLGEVHVFVPPKPAPRGMLHKGEATTRELHAASCCDLHDPDVFGRYFSLFYSKVNDTGTGFHDLLVKDVVGADLGCQFRTAGARFKLIDDRAQRAVVVRYGQGESLLKRLRFAGPTRDIMRRLQRFTVTLPARIVEVMVARGLLEMVDAKRAPDIFAQCNLNIYSEETGLDIYRELLPVEDLVL